MSWTTPRTWVTGEMISAPMLNTQIRDNLNETETARAVAAGQTFYGAAANTLRAVSPGVRKAAATTVTNTTVLVSVTDLVFPVEPGETWLAEFFLAITYTTTMAGAAIGWTHPGGTGSWLAWDTRVAAGIPPLATRNGGAIAASGAKTLALWDNGAPPHVALFNNGALVQLVFSSTGSGVVQLLFAQDVATAVNTAIEAGSTLLLTRLP